jgi:hypothetical protein
MDLEHALEIAEESKSGGYDSPTDLALQFLAEYVGNEDRKAREECAAICEKRAAVEYDAARANAALRCANRIRETINGQS